MHLRAYIYLIAQLLLSAVTAFTLEQPDNEIPNQAVAAGSPANSASRWGLSIDTTSLAARCTHAVCAEHTWLLLSL